MDETNGTAFSAKTPLVKLVTSMACLITGFAVFLLLVAGVAKAISGLVYRHLIETGHSTPARWQAICFIASFFVIAATVTIAGWIFFSTFRFER